MENGMNGAASFVGIIGSVVSFDLSGWARLRKRWTRWQCEIASLRIRAKTASGRQFVPTLSAFRLCVLGEAEYLGQRQSDRCD
jgi:hypothetical protein